jgi:hypothetical protein
MICASTLEQNSAVAKTAAAYRLATLMGGNLFRLFL